MLELDIRLSDESDIATMREMIDQDIGVNAAREAAAKIPAGKPGDCDLCGEWSGRLVGGACAPCRDRHKLP